MNDDWNEIKIQELGRYHFEKNLTPGADNRLVYLARKLSAFHNIYFTELIKPKDRIKVLTDEILDGTKRVQTIHDILDDAKMAKLSGSDVKVPSAELEPPFPDAPMSFTFPVSELSSKKSQKTLPESVFVRPGSFVHKTAQIGEYVYVGYFVLIGDNSTVGKSVILCDDVNVPPDSQIADNTFVTDSSDTVDVLEMASDFREAAEIDDNTLQSKIDAILAIQDDAE